MSINNLNNALFALSAAGAGKCFVGETLKITQDPRKKRIYQDLYTDIEKLVLPELRTCAIGTEKDVHAKCDQLRVLINNYSINTSPISEPESEKKVSLLHRITFEQSLLKNRINFTDIAIESKSIPTEFKALERLSQPISLSEDFPLKVEGLLDNELQPFINSTNCLSQCKLALVCAEEFIRILQKLNKTLNADSLHLTKARQTIIFPILKPDNLEEVALQLRIIESIMNSQIGYDAQISESLEKDLVSYKRSGERGAEFSSTLEDLAYLNVLFITLTSERSPINKKPTVTSGAGRILFKLAELITTISKEIAKDACLYKGEASYASYLTQCTSLYNDIEKQFEKCNVTNFSVIQLIKNIFEGFSATNKFLEKYTKNFKAKINHIKDLSKEGIRSLFEKAVSNSKNFFTVLEESGSSTTFTPKTMLGIAHSKKVTKSQKRRGGRKAPTPSAHVIDERIVEKTKELTLTAARVKVKKEPKELVYARRVRRWMKDDVSPIFALDPQYKDQTFSEEKKEKIIFQHAFTRLVDYYLKSEGLTTKEPEEFNKYRAVKRRQLIGTVVMDSNPDHTISGVFSYSKGTNGEYFHRNFTDQQAEVSSLNFLRKGLYNIDFPETPAESFKDALLDKEEPLPVLGEDRVVKETKNTIIIRDEKHKATITLAKITDRKLAS